MFLLAFFLVLVRRSWPDGDGITLLTAFYVYPPAFVAAFWAIPLHVYIRQRLTRSGLKGSELWSLFKISVVANAVSWLLVLATWSGI